MRSVQQGLKEEGICGSDDQAVPMVWSGASHHVLPPR